MKKIRTLIPAIASIVPCVMVPLSIASCNKPTVEDKHIVDPTAEEKQLEPATQYGKTAVFELKLKEDCTDDIFIIYGQSPESDPIYFSGAGSAINNTLSIYLTISSKLYGIGKKEIPFNLTVYNYSKDWYQVINGYSFDFTPQPLVTFTYSAPNFVYQGWKTKQIALASCVPIEAKVTATFSSNNPEVLAVDANTGVLAPKAKGSATIKIIATDDSGNSIIREHEVEVRGEVESIVFERDGYNIDINYPYLLLPRVLDKNGNDVTDDCDFGVGMCEYAPDKPIGEFDQETGIFSLSDEAKQYGGSSTISATYDNHTVTADVEIANFEYLEKYSEEGLSNGCVTQNQIVSGQSVVLPSRFYNAANDAWVETISLLDFQGVNPTRHQDISTFFISKNIKNIIPLALAFSKIQNLVVSENNHTFTSNIGGTEYNAVFKDVDNPDTLIIGSTNTTLPNTVTKLKEFSFYGTLFDENQGCKPKFDSTNIAEYGNSCFADSNIQEFEFKHNSPTLAESLFESCSNLTNVIFQENTSIAQLPKKTFYNCKKLANLTGTNLKIGVIGIQCFAHTGITHADLKLWGTTALDSQAFANCSELTKVTIPTTLNTIGYRSFTSCPKILDSAAGGQGITFEDPTISWLYGEHTMLDSNKILFLCSEAGSELINGKALITHNESSKLIKNNQFEWISGSQHIKAASSYDIDELIVPASVVNVTKEKMEDVFTKGIENNGFENKTCMRKAFLIGNTSHFEEIGNAAFKGCSNIEFVRVGSGIRNIGTDAFASCDKINRIEVDSAIIANSKDDCGGLFAKSKEVWIRTSIKLDGESYIAKHYKKNHEFSGYMTYDRIS